MCPIQVRNGTPLGNEPLCRSCTHVHMQKGYRESDELIFCTYNSWDKLRVVPFPVRECTHYANKDLPSRGDMEEIAIMIQPEPTMKRAGFRQSERDQNDG